MMGKCRIQLLGRLQFERDNHIHTRFRTQKTASLLAYLALHPGLQPRELLSGIIWPDDAPEAGRHSLRMALSSLRRQLETSSNNSAEDLFESNRFAVGLKSETFSTDVSDFDEAMREAQRANSDERAHAYERAVALYAGPFLPGFYDDWCLSEATRLQGAFEDALVFLSDWHRARGESELARNYGRRLAVLTNSPSETPSHPIESPPQAPLLPKVDFSPELEAKPRSPLLVTLLACDDGILTAKTADDLTEMGGRALSQDHSQQTPLWLFAGATSALEGAARLRGENTESLRLTLCTGEMYFDATKRPDTTKTSDLRERAMGLLASAQPGQTLCCEATMLLVRKQSEIQSQDLGQFHLPGLLLNSPAERIFQITWRDEPAREFVPLRATKARTPFIPRPLSRFFGREEELARLHALLDCERLVTLSGAGGSGKTRLALQFAHSLESSAQKAVYWVPLADVTSANNIADSILDAVGVSGYNSLSSTERLVQELKRDSTNSVILILDNFEHLIEGGAGVIETLLEKVPTLQCLATSRRVLGIGGEVELPLAPLAVPTASSVPYSPQMLEMQPSVRLFCDRARLVRPDFALTTRNASSVAELCRQLEGIPLALELAAARAGSLSPARILERLQTHQENTSENPSRFERFDFLHTTSRTAPARHRTLRAALDWSFEALSPALQTFFSRLCVFRGGCSVEAATSVGDIAGALDALEELRLCSLLFVRQNEEEPRFRMLETVRQYALERAYQRGEIETARRQHAAYFVQWAQAEAHTAVGADATARLQSWSRIKDEADNLRAALAWSTEHEPEWGLRLAMACHDFTGVHLSEREMNVERALHSVEQQGHDKQKQISPFLIAGALGVAAAHASNRGDAVKQTEFARRRLELMRDATDPEDHAWALFDWGCARRNTGHFAESRAALGQSQGIFEKVDASRRFQLLGWTLIELGLTAFYAGDPNTAVRDFERCEAAFTKSGDRDGQASAKSLRADILFHQEKLSEAQELWLEVRRIEQELGDERHHAWRRHQEGVLAVALGEFERGHNLLCLALYNFWTNGHKAGAVRSLLALSSYWLALNQPERALQLLRSENAERLQAGWPIHEGWRPLRESIWKTARLATSLSPTEAEDDDAFDTPPLDLATIVEQELRGFE